MSFERKKVALALAQVLGIGGAMVVIGARAAGHHGSGDRLQHQAHRCRNLGADRDDLARRHPGNGSADDHRGRPADHGEQQRLHLATRSRTDSPVAARVRSRCAGWAPTTRWCSLNGRRLATYGLADDGQDSYVDLQQIPFDAVERIEVLKDGASAIYGSDAVAGVVNIILRQTVHRGDPQRASPAPTTRGTATDYKGSITAGIGDLSKDRYNVFVTIDALKEKALPVNTRPKYIGSNRPHVHGAG